MRWGAYLPVSGSIMCDGRHQRRGRTTARSPKVQSIRETAPEQEEGRDGVHLLPQLGSLGSLHGGSTNVLP